MHDLPCGDLRIDQAFSLRRVAYRRCDGAKQEGLDWLSVSPDYTKRCAWYMGTQCREASVQEVVADLRLDWHAVKEMDKRYMREQLTVADVPRPAVIGMDGISIRKGHVYRIIVSDLEVGRPIWFGGVDRSEASTAMFFEALGPARSQGIRLAVIDITNNSRNCGSTAAPCGPASSSSDGGPRFAGSG
ncbi:MAG TPA: hypothetical protein VE869_05375 [Gemmatimonas sp.]|nr:hypothetical protein [Gemmatimonas sp.]